MSYLRTFTTSSQKLNLDDHIKFVKIICNKYAVSIFLSIIEPDTLNTKQTECITLTATFPVASLKSWLLQQNLMRIIMENMAQI